jgi:molybdopterin-containing oxidoreductase family iron-sulfur binding subunit
MLIEHVGRRTFLKLLGAAAPAVAATACSSVPPERIIPYVIPPEDDVPGVATWYATSCQECPAGCGLRVRTREGRAVKIEGNPEHPVNRGRLCIRGQAALQGLYNPDRIRGARRREVMAPPSSRASAGQTRLTGVEWEDALAGLADRIQSVREAGRSGRIAIVTPLLTGALDRLVDTWAKAVGGARRLRYEPFGYEAIRTASRLCFGREAVPYYDLAGADVLVSFGADFLETWLSTVEYSRAFTEAHRVRDGRKSRFIHVEPRLSLTASNADEWLSAVPGTEILVALAMVQVIVSEGRSQATAADSKVIGNLVAPYSPAQVADRTGIPAGKLADLARLFSNPPDGPGRSLAIGGGVAASGSNATGLQVALHLLNAVAGNVGRTVQFGPDSSAGRVSSYRDMVDLVESMRAGDVDILMIYDVNPAFTLPRALGFEAALERVPFVASLSNVLDETTARAHLVLPTHSPLESWGDEEPRAGVRSLRQPVMTGLFDSRHVGDILLDVGRRLGEDVSAALPAEGFYEYLRSEWQALHQAMPAPGSSLRGQAAPGASLRGEGAPGSNFDDYWASALQQGGVWSVIAPEPVMLSADVAKLSFDVAQIAGASDGLVLMPYASLHFYDGRGANRSWLQEIPDPVTKAVWSSWAEVHPDTAQALAAEDGQLVTVESPHGKLDVPLVLNANLRPGVVAIPIGQGHTEYGRYAAGRGVNPIALIDPAPEGVSGGARWLSVRVRVTPRELRRPVPRLQATERQFDRDVALAVSLDELVAGRVESDTDTVHRSLSPEHSHPEYRWGMAIDLDACTGCNACVAACYAENNVPVMGAEAMLRGRTMSWLRIERFVEPRDTGTSAIDVRFVPMLCQHCDHAPCETVCPVYATYHTDEGLNAQVYNRCVGTRYCSNNCPYKVRRFNWFQSEFPDPLHLQLNPDVTVRSLGVMEKCTFCVQRIQEGKDRAKDEKRPVRDGEVVPACAQTCPAQAIVFGDLNDSESRVSQLTREARAYRIFDGLNTRPAVTYLRKVLR